MEREFEGEDMPLINPANTNSQAFNPNVDNSELKVKANIAGAILVYLSFLLIIPLLIYMSSRNGLVRLQIRINEASGGIDVQLKKRRDTLEKLLDATKGSMKFEQDILTSVTSLRTSSVNNNASRVALDQNLSQLSGRIMATFEAYPQIKSTENVAKLMDSAEVIEQEIAATRRLYNSYVTEFNGRIFSWPCSVVATNMKLAKLPIFAASDEDKKDVKISFA